jgi:hypothetical protein
MKRNISIAAILAIVIMLVMFTGLMQKIEPQNSNAAAVNAENLVFKFIASADTGAGAGPVIYPGGDSVLTVSGITTKDEIRQVLKWHKYAPQSGDSSFYMIDYTDSVTVYNGYVKPAYWTYKDCYSIIYRSKN